MAVLSFLTPFLCDLRGVLSVAGQLGGDSERPILIGSAFIENGHTRLRDMPHAFENIKADILFNQQRMLINSFHSQFAGGSLISEGNIELKGLRDFPTNIHGRFEKVNLAIPKDFNTSGSGEFTITGNWFPFLFKGSYAISGGTITKSFADDSSQQNEIHRSSFLPDFLLSKGFETLKFDFNADFPSGLSVKNNVVDTPISGNVRLLGTTSSPIVLGTINLPPGGHLLFRDVPFEISGGTLRFQSTEKINPSIYTQASTRVKEYDINLILQGTKENYQIALRSTPPLAEQEIISLLALGYTSEQLEKFQSRQQVDQQGVEAASALLQNNPLRNEIRSKYGVNLDVSATTDDTNNFQPKVTLSKKWGKHVNSSASQTVGKSVTRDVKLEYQVNSNVSVIGSWQGKEFSEETDTTKRKSDENDIFGLDLQYRQEFQ